MSGTERNPVNRKKLPGSKWTAVRPQRREKHFIVLDWVRDDDGLPTDKVLLEAILTRSVRELDWRELGDSEIWSIGWHP
ncbi:MAG: TIGR02450 family Trp-rich protein [Holophagae bacterium]